METTQTVDTMTTHMLVRVAKMRARPSTVSNEGGVAVTLSSDPFGITVSVAPAVACHVSDIGLASDDLDPLLGFEVPTASSLLALLTCKLEPGAYQGPPKQCRHVAAAITQLRSCTSAMGRLRSGQRLAPWQEKKAREMLTSDLAATVSIDEVADACRMSRTYFARRFKRSMGLPPHQWLTGQRIEAAKRLLTGTDEPLGIIALRCGFGAQSRFSRSFHCSTGMNPRQWRRAFRREAGQESWSVAREKASGHVHVRGPVCPEFPQGGDAASADVITQLLHRAIVMSARLDGSGNDQLTGHIGRALHEHVSTASQASTTGVDAERLTSSQFARATSLLLSNQGQRSSIAFVASACGVSHGIFSRAFKARMGVSPRRWRTEKRIDRAKRLLLDSQMAMVDIADECGFSEQSHFNRVFMQVVGTPPGAWRRMNEVVRR